ncbi:MAG: hypothetical protein ACJ794_04490 [Gemmatimonadaceae bacterium]
MNQPLAETIFWIAAIACAVGEIAILRSMFATRTPASVANKSELVPQASRRGELAWAVIPALALAAIMVITWQKVDARTAHMQTMNHSGHAGMESIQMPPAKPTSPTR